MKVQQLFGATLTLRRWSRGLIKQADGLHGGGWNERMWSDGEKTAILTLKTDVSHPRLGSGLFALLKIPHSSELERINELSIEMNYLEANVWSKLGMPLIGNWCAHEYAKQERGFVPAFSSFVPNLFYQRGLAENILLYAAGRTRWARQMWMPDAIDLPMHEILSKRLNPGKLK